jgi:DNA-binding transcriptional ArsR family regulator
MHMTAPDPGLFAALADPTRLAIVTRLARGPATAGEIAAMFPISQPAISRHLKVLGRAGLIRRGRRAQTRPAELDPAAVALLAGWAGGLHAVLSARFQRIDEILAALEDDDAE